VARDVYSIRILATGGLIPSSGVIGPVVPAGVVWVVRDIDAAAAGSTSPSQLLVIAQTLGILWNVQLPANVNGGYEGWRGRQIYAEGEQVGVQSLAGQWSVAISGYQLTLP
jgi:hypothetical protein